MLDPPRTVREARRAFLGPEGWRAVAWPAAFAVVAVILLVYDHIQDRITHLIFWLCVMLIACVFAWLVETARRKARQLEVVERRATLDRVTRLPNRAALVDDLRATLSIPGERQTLVVLEFEGLRAYYDQFGDSTGDELVSQMTGRLLAAIAPFGGIAYRVDSSRFAVLTPGQGQSVGEILIAACSPRSGEDSNDLLHGRSYGEVTLPDDADEPDLALQMASQRIAAYRQVQQRSARRQAHAVLMAVLNARRPDLREHLRTVAYRSIWLSRRLGLDGDAIDDTFLAAELQDIGLLTVPEAVLEKGSVLDQDEVALIREQRVEGERIVAAAPGLASVAAIIRSISERHDGSGYPDGLAGDEIPLGARIIAVSVAFAAMTSHRPYQSARSEDEALAELQRCAGSQFDPVVVEALAADLAEQSIALDGTEANGRQAAPMGAQRLTD